MEQMIFGKNTFHSRARMLDEMRKVIFDREWAKSAQNMPVYFMFRQLFLNESHKKLMESLGICYDVTIIPPGRLGSEFVKTAGHYHTTVPETNFTYPEMYQVIEGEATYLLQKKENDNITDVVMIRAYPGDIVIVPPNYGHITINASGRLLKMANWVCTAFSSDYPAMEEKEGGAYFALSNGIIIPNKNYGNVPVLRFLKAKNPDRLGRDNIYSLINRPKSLNFLVQPRKDDEIFLL